MKKTRAISLLLSLSLICAMLVPGAAAFAESEGGNDSGMVINKTATANTDGSYTITLEAYATGSKIISEVTKDVPTDIVLVLDQSGSMAENMYTYDFQEYTNRSNSYLYDRRHNGGSENLYYKLEDGSYATVSVSRTQGYDHTKCPTSWINYDLLDTDNYYSNRNNLYVKIGDGYQQVTLKRTGSIRNRVYTYTFPNGDTFVSNGSSTSPGNFGGKGPLYVRSIEYIYTYTYTDKDGVAQTIGTSTGANTQPTEFTLYEQHQSGSKTRLQALKNAATSFANQVATKANGTDGIAGTGDDVIHRIAVVGYADSSSDLTNGFKEMNNTDQAAEVLSAIYDLTADGGTHIDQGLLTANGIFANNPISDTENRNRVVIVFTDGAPGSYGDWRSESVRTANNAIAYAKTAKKPTSEGGYGATVYTIGIFSGADASNPDSLPAYTSYTTGWFGSEQSPSEADQVKNSNRFMHLVSSNYPAASSITQPGNINPNLNGKSYYLSAGDKVSLNSIFQQISDQIETGGSSTTLSSETVIKDIIAPAFTLPANATADNITLETYQCTGKNSNNEYTWSKNKTAMGATAVIGSTDTDDATTTNNQVSVTGFDFAEHYVGTVTEGNNVTYRGHKLVISFTVKPRPGFLGGNAVYTNTSAGVYENSDATKPVLTFPQPDVDVTIKEPTITLPDANVYLGAYFSETVNAEDLKKGTKVKFGNDIELDLTKPNENWGLESWQTEYVTIEVKVTDKDGHEVTNFEKLTEDTEYKVSVSIKPKTSKEGNSGYDESMAGKIHVFKPELTFQDSTAYYGESVPENNNYSGNYVANSEKWKNGGKYSTYDGVQMIGAKPKLDITYTPDESKLEGGKYTKQDVPVLATVNIGTENVNEHTTFVHQDCTGKTCALPEGYHFWIHIQTCTLNITKQGGADDESYVFDVLKDGEKYSEVTVWGNGTETLVELPIGTYTVEEDTGWSWRFTVDNVNSETSKTLSASSPNGSITCVNTKNNNQWLNGFSEVVRNIFDTNH